MAYNHKVELSKPERFVTRTGNQMGQHDIRRAGKPGSKPDAAKQYEHHKRQPRASTSFGKETQSRACSSVG